MANCWRSARFSKARSESFWSLKNMFKINFSNIFIMDTNFAGLCGNVNNFSKDGIFANDSGNVIFYIGDRGQIFYFRMNFVD
jgi:hypothetical protein